ncbi:MAG TPA: HDOD domain-containing protein [Candidatus Acidoferrum sp.]|nr:HDOD domain-containing protein [Candidatus Acidoferrum sp.]
MSESIKTLIANRVDSKDFKLPVFSPIALEIQGAINADADLSAIERIIHKDQALAAEILRLANSAFFAGLSKQKTIQHALIRLGLNRVFGIVMMAAQKQAFQARNPYLNELMSVLWKHAAASAAGCRWVAMRCGYQDIADDAFLAGLLHDLGSLVVLKANDEILAAGSATEMTTEVMREVIDSLHTEYGHRVMKAWELPSEYADVARDHHSDANSSSLLLQIVKLVDGACRKVGIGMVHEPDLALEGLPEVKQLGIKDVYLAELEIELEDIASAIAGSGSVDSGGGHKAPFAA